MWSYLKFRWHRQARTWRKRIWLWRRWLGNYFDRHISGAWAKLGPARWMFGAWLLIGALAFYGLLNQIGGLDQFYITKRPVAGGVYSEGLLGDVRVLNPILPENTATSDIDRLIFNGLTRVNSDRKIEPDLAKSWEVSPDQKVYTFHLRQDVKWQDGVAFEARDVAFTIAAIQNPDSKSPLAPNWAGVKFDIVDNSTIRFTLPNSYSGFLSATTVGILPHHLLDSIRLSALRIDQFSQHPIGTGPYRLDTLRNEEGTIILKANQGYFQGKPNIDEMHFALYDSPEAMLNGYARKQILGISQLNTNQLALAQKIDTLNIYQFSLPAYVGLFFNAKSPTMADINLRKGINQAVDRSTVIDKALAGRGVPVYYPILPGQAGFNPSAVRYHYDTAAARKTLGAAKLPTKPLQLVTLKSPEYLATAELVRGQLAAVGVKVEVTSADTVTLQQNYIRPRKYDILLYGQNLGIDSDAYSFWHSSQIDDPGLNVANYKNPEADKALEGARLSRDAKARASRYANFVDIWSRDIPAMLLYSPSYLYGQDVRVEGLSAKKIAEPSDRFYQVEKWYLRHENVLKRSLGGN